MSGTSSSAGDGRSHASIVCVGCDYVLDGLPEATERCPECGLPTRVSRRSGTLLGADRRWLCDVRNGLAILMVAAVAAPGLMLLGNLEVVNGGVGLNLLDTVGYRLGPVCGGVLGAWGWWVATRREPERPERAGSARTRLAIRVSAVLAILGVGLFAVGTSGASLGWFSSGPTRTAFLKIAGFVCGTCVVLNAVAGSLFIAGLKRRRGRRSEARNVTVVGVVAGVLGVIVGIVLFGMLELGWTWPRALRRAPLWVVAIPVAVPAVAVLVYVGIVYEEACAIWARVPPRWWPRWARLW